ncbi:unnamed protein product [Malus baccata var. baccata]
MEKHPQGNEKEKEGSQSQTKEEGKCEFISRKQDGVSASVHDDIILHILKLYGSCATPSDFEIYSPNASFEDPLMCARGLKQIKSAFYSLPKVFSESRIVEYSVKENMVSPGNHEIWVDNKQHYKFMGKDIDMISLIKLSVLEGKVVRHEDWYALQALIYSSLTFIFGIFWSIFLLSQILEQNMLSPDSLMLCAKCIIDIE